MLGVGAEIPEESISLEVSLYLYRLHHPNSSSNLALICHIAPKRVVHLKALI
jgi:hypothetical protein